MEIQVLPQSFTVAKIDDISVVELEDPFTFVSVTDAEISVVCKTEAAPLLYAAREDGWRGLRVTGALDFAMIGVLSRLTAILAAEDIPVFVISTFDTDYIFIKEDYLSCGLNALEEEGQTIIE